MPEFMQSSAPDPFDERTVRARTEHMTVTALGGGIYAVEVASGNTYSVDLPGVRCTCPDHRYRGGWCKHLRRVRHEVADGTVPPPGMAPEECVVCGREVVVEEPVQTPVYCDRCDIHPGDIVVDRETNDPLLVVSEPAGRADETVVPDHDITVAEYHGNEDYPDDDPVVEVRNPLPAGIRGDELEPRHLKRYTFPVSRLQSVDESSPAAASLSAADPEKSEELRTLRDWPG